MNRQAALMQLESLRSGVEALMAMVMEDEPPASALCRHARTEDIAGLSEPQRLLCLDCGAEGVTPTRGGTNG